MKPFTVAYAALLSALIVIGAAGCPSMEPVAPDAPRAPAPRPPAPGVPPSPAPSVPGGESVNLPEDGPDLPPPPPPYTSPEPQTPADNAAAAPDVLVNLIAVSKDPATLVQVTGGWSLRSLGGTEVASGRNLSGDLVLGRDDARLGAYGLPGDGAVLVPETTGTLVVGKRRFPGTLRLARLADGRWRAAIATDLETYLEGVLAGELPTSFPREAMRAQAIVARTYVLSQAAQTSQAAGTPLSVDDTGASDQEFGGISSDEKIRAKLRDAVTTTRGLVLISGGKPLRTWYHSTCGGQTCPATVVFRVPPSIAVAARATGLGGAPCAFCTASPKYRWKDAALSADAVVKAAGLKGMLESFAVGETTLGGRAATFEIRAGGKTARVSAAEFRIAVGARSLPSTWVDSTAIKGKDLVLSGRGWGHGVGLCQFGAKGMADKSVAAEAIVEHYYSGAELKRLW